MHAQSAAPAAAWPCTRYGLTQQQQQEADAALEELAAARAAAAPFAPTAAATAAMETLPPDVNILGEQLRQQLQV
jgi:hypothetical protein